MGLVDEIDQLAFMLTAGNSCQAELRCASAHSFSTSASVAWP